MRGRGWLGWLVAGLAAAVALLLAVAVGGGDDRRALHVRSGSMAGGFGVETAIRYDSPRTILSGAFEVADRSFPAYFYDDDSSIDGDIVAPADVPAGHHLTVGTGLLNPPCAPVDQPPVLVVTSRTFGGQRVVDRFPTASSGAYAEAVRQWCSVPVHATVGGATISPGHWAIFRLQLINSSAKPIRVTSQAFRSTTTNWLASSVVIPPHQERVVAIRGEGKVREPRPWYTGHLVANGQIVHVGR